MTVAMNLPKMVNPLSRQGSPVVVMLVLAATLAGCGGPANEVPALIVGATCKGASLHCMMENGTLVAEGLAIDSAPNVAFLVKDLSVPLSIRGAAIHNAGTAIQIDGTCPICPVEVTNATLGARDYGVLLGAGGPVRSDVIFRHTTVVAERTGTTTRTQNGTVGMDGIGFYLLDMATSLILDDVHITAASTTNGRAVWERQGGAVLVASNLTIDHIGRAIVGDWSALALSDVKIDCVFDAIWANNPKVEAHRLRIANCLRDFPGCDFKCGAAVNLFGNGFANPDQEAAFKGLDLIDNVSGMVIGNYARVTIQDFNVQGGSDGIFIGFARDLELSDGSVRDQEKHGAVVGVDRMAVTRVNFHHNGFAKPSPDIGAGLDVRGFDENGNPLPGPRAIHQSSFTNNTPFGLISGFNDLKMDAANNWWGSPLGPSPGTPAALGNPPVPGFGDMVAGPALTEPHLTAPP